MHHPGGRANGGQFSKEKSQEPMDDASGWLLKANGLGVGLMFTSLEGDVI